MTQQNQGETKRENIEITFNGGSVEEAEQFIKQLEGLGYEVDIQPLPEPEPQQQQNPNTQPQQ